MVNYEIEPATDASGHIDGHVDKKGGEVDDLALTSVPITAAEEVQKHDLLVDADELADLEDQVESLSLDRTIRIASQLREMHQYDQNFPGAILHRISQFLDDPAVLENPDKHPDLIREVKLEAILAITNSPYQEVRANVDPTDDPSLPTLTVRVLVVGTIFAGIGSFIDTLFLPRFPSVNIGVNVGQMVAYPFAKAMEVLPSRKFRLFGQECSLNPGPFNYKEHMLITIMAQVSFIAPYTAYLIPVQALPVYFGQHYAFNFGYQLLATLGINFVGYGLAGLARRFIVYPSYALWPATLAQVALVKAFHTQKNEPVPGPFGWIYRRSQYNVFVLAFLAMTVWFFFPGFIFQALSIFNWISWIAPNHTTLNNIVGFNNGLGINPWPTFDWNNMSAWLVPLTIPTFSIVSQFIGICLGTIMTIIVYWKNAWNTSYLPINDNHTFDNQGSRYNVSRIVNDDSLFDLAKYNEYSQPWLSAGYLVYLFWYFAVYTATLTYVGLYHRYDIWTGARGAWKAIRGIFHKRQADDVEDIDDLSVDVHSRLMRRYPEVPEWEYLIVLIVAVVIGIIGVGVWPTHTSPAVVIYGIIVPLIAILPIGIIQAVTGIAIPLQILAQFIGGAFSNGSGIALMYFKSYGYISMYQAVYFCNDLKLAHYVKIPPRHTFYMQIWATLINSLVSAAILNFQMSFKDICTADAAFRFTCPGHNTFFTGAVVWGTIGPSRLFGPDRRYNLLLLGFPIGVLVVLIHYGLRRAFPKQEWIRQIHPVMIASGPSNWGSPYNLSYYWPNVMVAFLSFQVIRKRYLSFWAKYNYVIAAAFPCGIAVAALIIFFALEIPKGGLSIDWWGNTVSYEGCEGSACTRLPIPQQGYFGPAPGSKDFI